MLIAVIDFSRCVHLKYVLLAYFHKNCGGLSRKGNFSTKLGRLLKVVAFPRGFSLLLCFTNIEYQEHGKLGKIYVLVFSHKKYYCPNNLFNLLNSV